MCIDIWCEILKLMISLLFALLTGSIKLDELNCDDNVRIELNAK